MFSVCVCDVKPLSNAYHELAQVYASNNPTELRALVNKHSETFTRDSNTGLVKQCLSSVYKKNIQRLTKVWTYTNDMFCMYYSSGLLVGLSRD